MSVPHVVVIGSGFGGVYLAKKLSSLVKKGVLRLTIISKSNYFLFTPLLHEVATGGLSPTNVTETLREIFSGDGVEILQAEVLNINAESKEIFFSGHVINYDYLVVATGAENNYYGIPGAREHSLSLKNLREALLIRERVIDAFEQAALAKTEAEKRQLLSFVVVGGGPTGIELVSELAEFVYAIEQRYFRNTRACCQGLVSVTLVHAGEEILPFLPLKLRQAAHRQLERIGVDVMVNAKVSEVTQAGVVIDGGTLESRTVVWAGGVQAVFPVIEHAALKIAGGRIEVDQFLRVRGIPNLYALGDVASFLNRAEGGILPMLAQVAAAEAEVAAKNIVADIRDGEMREFRYHSKGFLVSLGQWYAVGQVLGISLRGRLAWWLWRTIYLFKIASWKKCIRIAFDWTVNLFYPRDITKLS